MSQWQIPEVWRACCASGQRRWRALRHGSHPTAFVQRTRVRPLDTADGVRIGVIFALLPFELDAIRRARDVTIADRTVHVVTPEDLILMKIIF